MIGLIIIVVVVWLLFAVIFDALSRMDRALSKGTRTKVTVNNTHMSSKTSDKAKTKQERALDEKKKFVENLEVLDSVKDIYLPEELQGGIDSEKEKLARRLEDLM